MAVDLMSEANERDICFARFTAFCNDLLEKCRKFIDGGLILKQTFEYVFVIKEKKLFFAEKLAIIKFHGRGVEVFSSNPSVMQFAKGLKERKYKDLNILIKKP